MKVCQKELVGISQLHAQLMQTLSDTTSTIEKQRLAAGLYQRTGSEAIHQGLRAAGAKQGYAKVVAIGRALRPRGR
jgi:hypothetical protein